jgi:hypothetical protein
MRTVPAGPPLAAVHFAMRTALLFLIVAPGLAAQGSSRSRASQWPFAVGERLVYEGKYGPFHVGSADVLVEALDTVRGREVFRVRFGVTGGLPGLRVRDAYTSWFDSETLVSYRYDQSIHDPGYNKERHYEIMPDRGIFVLSPADTSPTVQLPLDDGSFLYFVRTIPLEVGQRYTFDRYFKPDGNPVVIEVVRRDTVRVPAGTFPCLVLKPTIRTTGLFSEDGHAEVWISDDDRRLIVQMKLGVRLGSLSLYLRTYTPPPSREVQLAGGTHSP